MEYNQREISKHWLQEKFEQKLCDLEAQKVCIAKYKQFLDYVKKIDVEKYSNYEQMRLLVAYLFCSIGNKNLRVNESFSTYTQKCLQRQENVNQFDYVQFAKRLIGDCVEKKVWLDKTFLLDYGCCEDYGWFEYLKICRPYIKIACQPNFDDAKTYTEQQILDYIKNKQVFLIDLGFEENEKEINSKRDIKYVDAPTKNTMVLAKDIQLGDGVVASGTILTNNGQAISETYDSYKKLKSFVFDVSQLNNCGVRYIQTYQKQTNNIYQNFSKHLLEHFLETIPNEIKARNAKFRKTKTETENFVKKNYQNYTKSLEEKILETKKEEAEKLEKLNNIPEENSHFEF